MPTYYIDLENGSDAASGADWANAWLTITNGATAARIAPADEIRISKTPDPVSLGNGTWTADSATVTLASAATATIDNCESAWTAANSATVATNTDEKQGTNSMRITAPGSPATATKYAYYQISDTDYSSYQEISFWWKNQAADVAGNWKVCLCSDTAGDTIVDTFLVPAVPSSTRYVSFNIAKSGGGNLGASIQSIAIYSDTVTPTASNWVQIDNIFACTTNGLNLNKIGRASCRERVSDYV